MSRFKLPTSRKAAHKMFNIWDLAMLAVLQELHCQTIQVAKIRISRCLEHRLCRVSDVSGWPPARGRGFVCGVGRATS